MKNFPEIKNTYKFKCSRCANCCTGDQKVHLDLYDLYKLARFHNYAHTGILFAVGLVILIPVEQGVFLPRIRFKHKPFRFCPFLINEAYNGLCSLHPDYKPLVCTMAPVGREVDFENGTDRYLFVKPAPDCPGVHSEVQNNLTDLKEMYTQELNWQKTFFHILHHLQTARWTREVFLEKLYTFHTHIPFSEILSDFERQFISGIPAQCSSVD